MLMIHVYLFELFKINDPKIMVLISNTLLKLSLYNCLHKKINI
jgi:hypothetical protein